MNFDSNTVNLNTLSDIKMLDTEKFKRPSNIVITGKRYSGKTTLVQYIASKQESSTKFYYFSNKNIINNSINGDIITDFSYLKDIIEIQKESNNKNHIMVIFDEIIFDKKSLNKYFFEYIRYSRHANITNIITLQMLNIFALDILSEIDLFLFFEDNNISNLKTYYEKLFGMFEKFNDFQKWFRQIAQDHNLVCIDRSNLFWYKYDKTNFIINTEYIKKSDNEIIIKDKIKEEKIILIKKILEQNEKLIGILNDL